ncbi:MAG TPA: hypothetical protein VHI13_06120 [Candidatus Kapabacteria bacterium]|nr:hypothetical protein [Candidatus Kapabacteria bacterium]
MPTESQKPCCETLLGAQQLRELVREARGGFTPDHVARTIRDEDPALRENDVVEIAEILEGLVQSARERLHDAGIEPAEEEAAGSQQRLSKREREYTANLITLLVNQALAVMTAGRTEDALRLAAEALAWSRTIGDRALESLAFRVMSEAYSRSGAYAEQEQVAVRAEEAARASGNPLYLISALQTRATNMLGRWRLDEAEPLVAEAFDIVREEFDEEEECRYYGALMICRARIQLMRLHYPEAIQLLREALRWAERDRFPVTRTTLYSQLGSTYLRIAQYRQAIECHHEVVLLSEHIGSALISGWGYFRLAHTYMVLKEFDEAAEALSRAEDYAGDTIKELGFSILNQRARLFAATERYDDASEICRSLLKTIGDRPLPNLVMSARCLLGDMAIRQDRFEEAVEHYRIAAEFAETAFPQRIHEAKIGLARALLRLERNAEFGVLINEIRNTESTTPEEQLELLRLMAADAEQRNDLRAVLDHERQAFELERTLLERQSEQSLRNARVMAETDLLERTAELERERRRRAEHELADAMVQLSDRTRLVEVVEQRLRRALVETGPQREQSAINALRETLSSLRTGMRAPETPLAYLGSVDDEFFRRLRERFPGLTPKQERLCGLLRAGLSSREIGTLLNIEAEGLKAQRKRLRKRLGMEPEASLEKMMAEM